MTYKKIQEDIKKNFNKSVKICWIAHVKELHGLPMRTAWNRTDSNKRKYPCPDEIKPLIEDSLRKFGIL